MYSILALKLSTMNPILPMNTTQQSFDENATLRKLRMDALQVCFLSEN